VELALTQKRSVQPPLLVHWIPQSSVKIKLVQRLLTTAIQLVEALFHPVALRIDLSIVLMALAQTRSPLVPLLVCVRLTHQ
jgi:hypothetical protein